MDESTKFYTENMGFRKAFSFTDGAGHPITVEHGKVEAGAEVLLAISRKSRKSLEWLLTEEG